MNVISVENLSKVYRLGQIGTGTFAHDLVVWWAKMRGKPNPKLRIGEADHGNRDGEEIMALRDVSFTVRQGEVLGIIGRNGAGKSTLLKILSRVTAPTSGKINLKGRIASLLEVGTGFHPELTGRENIYLNGVILGMKRNEIHRRFDEIVDFAEINQFIDTPVKRYSSGMYVRLAFSVAAHLNSDILIVDEVLAVGDQAFQKKCLEKMGDVSRGGRSILFVSHNLASIKTLCDSGLVLYKGCIAYGTDKISNVLDFYNKQVLENLNTTDLEIREDRKGNGAVRVVYFEILDSTDDKLSYVVCGDYAKIRLHYKAKERIKEVSIAISLGSSVGENLILISTEVKNYFYSTSTDGGYFDCVIPKFPLTPGSYLLNVYVSSGKETLDWIREAGRIEVIDGDFYGVNRLTNLRQSSVLVDHYWE